jgi:transcription elongation factor Elf1
MDLRAGIGSLSCRICGASYQMSIHHLHEPIDVFSEWLDDCEAAAAAASNEGAAGVAGGPGPADDEDDELPATSGLKQRSTNNDKKRSGARDASIDLGSEDSENDDDDDE